MEISFFLTKKYLFSPNSLLEDEYQKLKIEKVTTAPTSSPLHPPPHHLRPPSHSRTLNGSASSSTGHAPPTDSPKHPPFVRQELVMEARALRQHKGHLEARMHILENHNRQLESQLEKLWQLLESDVPAGNQFSTPNGNVNGNTNDGGQSSRSSSIPVPVNR